VKICPAIFVGIMKKILTAVHISMLLLISSCQQHPGNAAAVKGTFTDAGGFKLILEEMDIREIHPVDSIAPDQEGQFKFSVPLKESGFWLLKAPTGKILVLLLNPGDQVYLSGSTHDFPDNVSIKGPEGAMLLNDFYRKTRLNERKVDSLEMLLAERQDSSDYYNLTKKLDASFQEVWESQRSDEMAFIDHHVTSLGALIVLNYAFGMSPVLSLEEDFGYYVKLDSALFRMFPENKHVKFHHQRVENQRKASAGK
jgi:hypothetical protein